MKARLLIVPSLLVGSVATAHIVQVVRGVHFKTQAIDFGQPPLRRGYMYDAGTGMTDFGAWRPGTKYRLDPEARYEGDERDAADRLRLLRSSAAAEAHGDLAAARAAYREMKARGLASANFLNSRLELLSAPGLAGTLGLTAYLRATHPTLRAPLPTVVGPVLRPWLAYTRARTPQEYAAVAASYPASSRAPAALVMAARGGRLDAARTLLRRYPISRFAWDAHGLLARTDFLAGRRKEARAQYEAQARTADTPERKANAFQSILMCVGRANRAEYAHVALRWAMATDAGDPYLARHVFAQTAARFTAADARAFSARLTKDPASLVAYLEYRTGLEPGAKDVLNMDGVWDAAYEGPYAAKISAILARTALARGDGRAEWWARQALRGKGDDHALGLFVLSALDRRAGRLDDAKTGFERLLREHSASYLAGGARENLAILDERLGDLAGAMDHYRALGYRQDVAYLADARMSPAELAAYVAAHPKEDALRYTLAMRYLRRGEWDAAENALRPLGDAKRRRLTDFDGYEGWARDEGGLQDPLATVRALRKLDLALAAAEGAEAKAAALNSIGDYYYSHKCLLLYSGPAWNGSRNYDIAFSWNPAVATETDDEALRLHHDEHECYVHARTAYDRVLKEFPNTKAAPHAAYWSAVAAKRLSNMAPYWRWRDRREDLKAESIRLMALAAKGGDPTIAKRAKKYGPVFAEERAEFRKAFANDAPPPRRWTPN